MIVSPRISTRTIRKMGRRGERFTACAAGEIGTSSILTRGDCRKLRFNVAVRAPLDLAQTLSGGAFYFLQEAFSAEFEKLFPAFKFGVFACVAAARGNGFALLHLHFDGFALPTSCHSAAESMIACFRRQRLGLSEPSFSSTSEPSPCPT